MILKKTMAKPPQNSAKGPIYNDGRIVSFF